MQRSCPAVLQMHCCACDGYLTLKAVHVKLCCVLTFSFLVLQLAARIAVSNLHKSTLKSFTETWVCSAVLMYTALHGKRSLLSAAVCSKCHALHGLSPCRH